MMRFKQAGRFVLLAALSTATGCQNGFSVPIWNPFAKSTTDVTQPDTPSFGPKVPEESWAKKFTNAITAPFKSDESGVKKPNSVPENDPISLSTKTSQPNSELFVSLAKLQERTGNTSGAIEEYNKALDVDPKNLPAMLGLARLYDRQGRYEDALKLYRTAVEQHPENAAAANDYGLCLARSGNVKDSARVLRTAVALDPEKILYRNNLATVLVELNRAEEAYQTLVPAHGEAVAHYNVGFLLNKRETAAAKAAAYEHFQAAAEINPNFKEAQQWLVSLKKFGPESPSSFDPSILASNVASEMMPPASAIPTAKPVPSYPATSTPTVLPELPLISTEPAPPPATTSAPVRSVSQPTFLQPTETLREEAQRQPTAAPLNLNSQGGKTPVTQPAAMPPLPEQISTLATGSGTSPAATLPGGATKPTEIKAAARYPASRY